MLPAIGSYDVVFDLAHSRRSRPVPLPLLAQRHDAAERTPAGRAVAPGGQLRLRLADHGSGVCPVSSATIDEGRQALVLLGAGVRLRRRARPRSPPSRLPRLRLPGDRNHENVYRILPNTRSCVRRSASADPPAEAAVPAAATRERASRSRRGLVRENWFPHVNSCGGRARRSWGAARGRAGRWPRSRPCRCAGAEGSLCGAPLALATTGEAGLTGDAAIPRRRGRAPRTRGATNTQLTSISLSVAARPRTSDYATRSGRSPR